MESIALLCSLSSVSHTHRHRTLLSSFEHYDLTTIHHNHHHRSSHFAYRHSLIPS
ncbi:hypothetical protein L211DRAFT_108671 [Terfezia boudieri ATCC MYA-4762]|uniref:Uncharacterized protein n=1 Tax=Terfezia boudieri ATCC MYA-4762 TaxID=1051890 RepID=A0A3N4LR05_9PEZI|nr:hypothetical protein L211DRAFT_108671 [Terfezia boudieri ATCC MYA-4762]